MRQSATAIPDKIFFKIGEVCDIVEVQAHVLRYWETEFPQLSPQKNRSGQRTYRRRDVEIALRIKELLYDELFTIAGAKKKLQSELRESTRLKIVPPAERHENFQAIVPEPAAEEFIEEFEIEETPVPEPTYTVARGLPVQNAVPVIDDERREAIKSLASQLLELREMLKAGNLEEEKYSYRRF